MTIIYSSSNTLYNCISIGQTSSDLYVTHMWIIQCSCLCRNFLINSKLIVEDISYESFLRRILIDHTIVDIIDKFQNLGWEDGFVQVSHSYMHIIEDKPKLHTDWSVVVNKWFHIEHISEFIISHYIWVIRTPSQYMYHWIIQIVSRPINTVVSANYPFNQCWNRSSHLIRFDLHMPITSDFPGSPSTMQIRNQKQFDHERASSR